MEIVAIGGPEFSLGFELAGVRAAVTTDADAETRVNGLLAEQGVGILVIDQHTFDLLAPDTRERMLRAPHPVTVVLSKEDSNAELREMIIRSIGVDLWKQED